MTPGVDDLLFAGTALGPDAGLYRMLAAHGYGPEQVDEWENWQTAQVIEGILDRAHAEKPRRKGQRHRPRTARATGPTSVRSGSELLRQRIAHAEGRGVRPEPQPPGRDAAGLLAAIARTQQPPQPVDDE